MMDVKSVTEDFYLRLVESVNSCKKESQIEFRRDEKFLKRRTPAPTDSNPRSFSAEK